jgi:hypothetical protein
MSPHQRRTQKAKRWTLRRGTLRRGQAAHTAAWIRHLESGSHAIGFFMKVSMI